MIVFFIEESDKNRLFKSVERTEDRVIIHKNVEKLDKKTMKKINKILDDNNCNKVIVSNKLKQNKEFLNNLYCNNIDIIDGKKLYKELIESIIEKACTQNHLNAKKTQITLMVNYVDSKISNLIENLSKKFKILSVVSSNINSFKKIKEKLYNEYGIIIAVTNNKRKALLKSELIVNYDFAEEVLNKYVIFDNAVIISLEEPINIHKKRFTGKIINDFEILFVQNSNIELELRKDKYNKFDLKDLAEIFIMQYPEEINNIII